MPRVINQDGWVTSKFTRDSFDGRGWAFKPSGQLYKNPTPYYRTRWAEINESQKSKAEILKLPNAHYIGIRQIKIGEAPTGGEGQMESIFKEVNAYAYSYQERMDTMSLQELLRIQKGENTDYKRNKYKENLFEFWRACIENHSTTTEALDISDGQLDWALYYAATKLGKDTLKSKLMIVLTPILTIVSVATAIVTTIMSAGGAAPVWVAIASGIGAAVSISFSILDETVFQPALIKSQISQVSNALLKNDLSKDLMKQKDEAKKKSEQQTSFLIYAQQAILPGGSIYNAGAAGSPSYNPSQAYDPNKGINGEYEQSEQDNIIQNRTANDKAGGAGYFASVLNIGQPLAKAKEAQEFDSQRLKQENKEWEGRIKSAMAILVRQGFGYGTPDTNGFINEVMKQLYATHIYRRVKKEYDTDNPQSARNYNADSKSILHRQIGQQLAHFYNKIDGIKKENEELRPINDLISRYNATLRSQESAKIKKATLETNLQETLENLTQNQNTTHPQTPSATGGGLNGGLESAPAQSHEAELLANATKLQNLINDLQRYITQSEKVLQANDETQTAYTTKQAKTTTQPTYMQEPQRWEFSEWEYNELLIQWQHYQAQLQKYQAYQNAIKDYEAKEANLIKLERSLQELDSQIKAELATL